jgi:hypothetical protein
MTLQEMLRQHKPPAPPSWPPWTRHRATLDIMSALAASQELRYTRNHKQKGPARVSSTYRWALHVNVELKE